MVCAPGMAVGSCKRRPLDYSAWRLIPLEQIGPVSDRPDIVPSAITSNATASAFTNTWKGVS